jgi:tRNA nucleotidyltransferase (CCA-adding enzyme)
LAVLAHDFAKPQTTQRALKDGTIRIISPGHEEAGGPLAQRFLERIHAPHAIQQRVVPLVVNHLAHLNPITDRSVRRLAKRLEPETIDALCLIIAADQFGRPPRPRVLSENVEALAERAAALRVEQQAPKPILMGRHLLELGLKPGRLVGQLVDAAYEAQLEGDFESLHGALVWLRSQSRPARRTARHASIHVRFVTRPLLAAPGQYSQRARMPALRNAGLRPAVDAPQHQTLRNKPTTQKSH